MPQMYMTLLHSPSRTGSKLAECFVNWMEIFHMKTWSAILLLSLAILPDIRAQKKSTALEKEINAFDAYAVSGMKDFRIPGMAVAVVRDGQVIFAKAYGVRKADRPEPVDLHTQFSIGSTTKAITAVCMGMLVDEGKVRWDDPVIRYLPDLQLHDAYVTRHLRIRDLFTHNSGVGNTDFLWGEMEISSDEIIRKMAQVEPAYGFRGGFLYQNIFYLIAGQVIEKTSGMPWHEFIKKRVFLPLGLTHTVATLADGNRDNEAHPHYLVDGTVTVLRHSSADKVGPAGSVRSCITDMAEWTRCMLDSSKHAGGRLLKADTWAEMFAPQVIVPESQFYPTKSLTRPSWTTYGLGWFQQDYQGRRLNFHTGSLPGEIALHAQMPSEKTGYFFLGNLDHAELRHALMYRAFDRFALASSRDWNLEIKALYDRLSKNQEQAIARYFGTRVPDTRPSRSLADFIGNYADPLRGTLTIGMKDGRLIADLNGVVTGTLEHFHYDTFVMQYPEAWMGKGLITFHTAADGKVAKVEAGGIGFLRK